MKYPHTCLVLFARAPVTGQVKTRLIPALGAEGACALYQSLLQRALGLLQQAPCAAELWVDEQPAHPAFAAFPGEPRLQQGPDLGARLAHAAADVLQRYRQVLFIGTDCPALDAAYLEEALTALQGDAGISQPTGLDSPPIPLPTPKSDRLLVIGPATDGGYVLLGLAGLEPALFRDIDWGGPQVLQQTLARAASCDLVPHLLPGLPDIDRPEDLRLLPCGLVPAGPAACGYNAALIVKPECRCPPTTEVPDE